MFDVCSGERENSCVWRWFLEICPVEFVPATVLFCCYLSQIQPPLRSEFEVGLVDVWVADLTGLSTTVVL